MSDAPKGPSASAGYHLWHASLRWTQEIGRALAPLGLTHTQFFVLGAVGWVSKTKGSPPKQREVAEFAQFDKVMTSQVTRTLVADGLLLRADDPDDSRAWLITLTPKGERMLKDAAGLVREVDVRFFGAQAAALREALSKLHDR